MARRRTYVSLLKTRTGEPNLLRASISTVVARGSVYLLLVARGPVCLLLVARGPVYLLLVARGPIYLLLVARGSLSKQNYEVIGKLFFIESFSNRNQT